MSARRAPLAAFALATLAAASPAQAEKPGNWSIGLTEAPQPESRAWERPGRIALTIDPDGPDEFSAQLNLAVKRDLRPDTPESWSRRPVSIGGHLRWNRETGSDRQNNFEAGATLDVGYNVVGLLGLTPEQIALPARERAELAARRSRRWDFTLTASSDFARTAHYPDLASATCVATPSLPQCQTQIGESVRTSISVAPFNAHLEDRIGRGLVYSLQPKVGIDHDYLFNSPINVDTGVKEHGGYLSGVGAVSLLLAPRFVRPQWELQTSFQLRQRLDVSGSRAASIERSAELFDVSLTFFHYLDHSDNPMRVGLGVTYSNGGDPLTGAPDVERIVLALRIGRF